MSKKVIFTESQMKRIMGEDIKELNLYHGTHADFDKFNFAYLSSGWGQQAYGYGFYLTDNYEAAKGYSGQDKVYTVEVPDKPYLPSTPISMREKQKIANAFFKYYTEENPDTVDSYPDEETKRCFWEYEVKCILNCYNGSDTYGTVSSLLGSDKETSEFFHRLGYVGLKAYDENDVTGDSSTTYIIFDENDIKIVNKEQL